MADIITTLGPSGRDYSSPVTWEAAEQTDLVTAGDTHTLACDAAEYESTSGLALGGWTTGPSNGLTIRAAAGDEHNGVIGSGVIFSTGTASYYQVFSNAVDYVTLQDIQITSRNIPEWGAVLANNANHTSLIGCIFTLEGTIRDNATACSVGFTSGNIYVVRSCIIFIDTTTAVGCRGITQDGDNSTGSFYQNITIVHRSSGASGACVRAYDGGSTFQNFLIYSPNSNITGIDIWRSSNTENYNATHDATGTGTGSITGITSAVFADYANNDFRPASAGSAFGAGIDLSGSFTNDISNVAFSDWSMGAFDQETAGGGLTGATVVLTTGSISAGQTSLGVIGGAAISLPAHSITAEQSAIGVSGHASTSLGSQAITAEQGGLSVFGHASTSLGSQTITAEQGGLSVLGHALTSLGSQTITAEQGGLSVLGHAVVTLGNQVVSAAYGAMSVDAGTGWAVLSVDLDNSIVDEQTGVTVALSGVVSATGKTVWIEQSSNWIEQTVTAQDASSITFTVDYGGLLNSGPATLYVRNPL